MTATAYFKAKTSDFVIATDNASLWASDANYDRMTRKAGKEAHKAYAKARLLEILNPGDTVYTVLRHVSRSGMRRHIDAYVIRDGEHRYLSGYAATVLDWPMAKQGIIVDGCGMDMGFQLVYSLGYALWPNGTPEPHGTRNGEPDRDGGYALKHHWL